MIIWLNVSSSLQGFRKTDPDQWEFANEEFIRGQRHLLKNIYRRKPIHSHSSQGNTIPLSDSEREYFEKEIQLLEGEKVSIQSQVERHKHENQGYKDKLGSLKQKLQNIDSRQKQLMNTLAQVLEKPRYTFNTIELSESQNKKRRSAALHFLQGEGLQEDNRVLESSGTPSIPLINLEHVVKLDSSLTFWEKFIHGVQNPSEDFHDGRIITEMAASSGDSDLNMPSCHMSASTSSSTYVGSPAISSICIDLDSRVKPVAIDVNISPTKTPDNETPKKRELPSATAGPNDVFWQQFLTEAPGSSTTQEVQSERRE